MRARWILLVVFLVGCTSGKISPSQPGDEEAQVVWPKAPGRARIRYLYSFSNYKDLNLSLPFSKRFSSFLAGQEPNAMVRPYTIAVDEHLIAVTDPGIGAVHLFDINKNQYRRIDQFKNVHFNSPVGVALSSNRIFIADSALDQIFIFDRSYNYLSKIENLNRPTGVAWDSETKRLFVAETLSHHIQVYNRDGNFILTIGKRGTGPAEFNFPTHIAIKNDLIFVNDTLNFRIQLLEKSGNHLKTFGKHGDIPGYLSQPKGIAIDSESHVYVAEALNNRVQVFDTDGVFLMDFGNDGNSPGAFSMPAGLVIFDDRLYVCDSRNSRIQVFEYLRGE